MMPKAPGQPDNPTAPKKTNWLLIVGICFGGLIAMVAGIIALVFWAGGPTLKTGETFLTQLSSNQVDTAYDSGSIEFKNTVSKEQFNGFLVQFPVLTKVKSTSFNSFSIENNFATISGTITATDGQVAPITMQLVNENGQWRVLNLDLNPPAPDTSSTSTIIDEGY